MKLRRQHVRQQLNAGSKNLQKQLHQCMITTKRVNSSFTGTVCVAQTQYLRGVMVLMPRLQEAVSQIVKKNAPLILLNVLGSL
jgi:hypothetical protein